MPIQAERIDWNDPSQIPMSNGPIRTVTGPALPKFALDSDRTEMEYLLAFPFHAMDRTPWPPLTFISNGIPVTIYRPLGTVANHSTSIQKGNENADAYCTVIRLSRPIGFELSSDDGWKIIKRLLEWIRVKCRHYWLLHGINGFGAAYRGTLFTRDGGKISQQNLAMYGPNIIVNPLTAEIWATLTTELADGSDLPIADALYCDALLSVVAGDPVKALLEAGVAIEIALTKLLVDVSTSQPLTPAKNNFLRKKGDFDSFGKKLTEWTRNLGLLPIENFSFQEMPQDWHVTARALYKLRNGVAHGGVSVGASYHDVVKNMFAAGALLEYCRTERIKLGLPAFTMPQGVTPVQQIRSCHDACISTSSQVLSAFLPV